MTIGERVVSLLEEKGIKQKELADYLKTKPSTIHGWKSEGRNPSSETIIPICVFLGTTPEYILTGEEKSPPILNKEEQRMLDLFRRLPPAGRDRMINRAEGYLEGVEDTLSQASASKDSQASGN